MHSRKSIKTYDVQVSNVKRLKTVYVDSSSDNTDKNATGIDDGDTDDDNNANLLCSESR
jgi:hypothetical protein